MTLPRQMKAFAFLVLLLVPAACGGGGAASTTVAAPDTTSSLGTSTTSPLPSTTTTPADGEDEIAPWRGGAAGEYSSGRFPVRFIFTTPSAWSGSSAEAHVVLNKGDHWVFFVAHPSLTVEETIGRLGEMDGLVIEDSPVEIDVGGAAGLAVEVSTGTRTVVFGTMGNLSVALSPNSRCTFMAVDVAGTTVEVSVDRGPGLPFNFEEDAQVILDSIQWEDLS